MRPEAGSPQVRGRGLLVEGQERLVKSHYLKAIRCVSALPLTLNRVVISFSVAL